MEKRPVIIRTARGMHSGGDPALIPDGFCRKIRNMLRRPNRWEARPAFTYDGIAGARGLALWQDETNAATRLLVTDDSIGGTRLKATTGEGYAAPASDVTGQVRDFANLRGTLYIAANDGSSGLLARPVYMNANTVSTLGTFDNATVDAGIIPRCLASYIERVFLGGLDFSVTSRLSVSETYDAASWSAVNVNVATIVTGAGTICRVNPTNATTASLSVVAHTTVANSAESLTALVQLRGAHESYRMPVTVQLRYSRAWQATTAYEANEVRVPTAANGFRYRISTAGTSAGAEPAWPTTVNATVADGTATWICDGTDVAAETKALVPNATDPVPLKATYLTGDIPAYQNGAQIAVRIAFGHGAALTTLAAVDFSLKDSYADGDARKANFGQQVTVGRFPYPFTNDNDSESATVTRGEYIYWTAPLEPKNVSGAAFFRLTDVPGFVTALRPAGGRLFAFKRRLIAIFAPVLNDPDNPIAKERVLIGVGALNPKAVDVFEDTVYFVGEDEIYSIQVGDAQPTPLCGDAMREEIMSKSSASWVESQAFPANRALLTVDQKHREVWVYTQNGKLYCYDIDDKAWSTHDAGGDASVSPVGYQIADMIYNPNTGNVYLAFSTAATGTAGLARLDATQTPAQDQISSSGTLPVHHEAWFKPLETRPRVEMRCDQLKLYTACTVTGQTATAYVSTDKGQTFSATSTPRSLATTNSNYEPERFTIGKGHGSLMARVVVSGKAGAGAFAFSDAEFEVMVTRDPEVPKR